MMSDRLSLVSEIVPIHTDAMPTHQPGSERKKVPFCPCRSQNVLGIDDQFVESNRQFIYERNVHVPQSVFYYFGYLRKPNLGGILCACGEGLAVKRAH